MSNSGKLFLLDGRTEYPCHLTVNGRQFARVLIDPHYKEKHHASVNDEIILGLVAKLDGRIFPVEMSRGDFEYITVEPVIYVGKPFRIIVVMCLGEDYLGVVNAFRVNGG